MKRREFFTALVDTVRTTLPPQLRDFEHRQTMNLLKIHYNANFRIHYEASIITETGLAEIGLHFEDGPESTSRLLEFFDGHILEIKHELGEQCELERWTRSWGHLFEFHSLEPLTDPFVQRLGEPLSRYIEVLQPLLDEAFELELASTQPRPGKFGRFRRGRKRF